MKQGRSNATTMNYERPEGPKNIEDAEGPGLHGNNCGPQGSQGPHSGSEQTSGGPGLHGENHGTSCYQGKH